MITCDQKIKRDLQDLVSEHTNLDQPSGEVSKISSKGLRIEDIYGETIGPGLLEKVEGVSLKPTRTNVTFGHGDLLGFRTKPANSEQAYQMKVKALQADFEKKYQLSKRLAELEVSRWNTNIDKSFWWGKRFEDEHVLVGELINMCQPSVFYLGEYYMNKVHSVMYMSPQEEMVRVPRDRKYLFRQENTIAHVDETFVVKKTMKTRLRYPNTDTQIVFLREKENYYVFDLEL